MRLAAVAQSLKQLPDPHREILMLVRIEGMSYADAAEALEISVNLVGVRLVRALDALRKAMGVEKK